jgi:adhesin transport system outer membrane protein
MLEESTMKFALRTVAIAVAVATTSFAASAQGIPEALKLATRKAIDTNPEVQGRWRAFLAADAERSAAYGTYRPQVDLQLGSITQKDGFPTRDVGFYTSNNAGISLTQTIYDWNFTASEVSRFSFAKLVRYYEVLEIAENTALEVIRAYADVQRYRETLEEAKTNYVLHKQTSEQIGERSKAGVSKGVDAEQAAGRLALAEANLLTEVANLHDVGARYLRIVGEPPSAKLPELPEVLNLPGIPATVRKALEVAYINNPSLNAAVENVDAARGLVDSRKSYLGPRFDFKLNSSQSTNVAGAEGSYSNQSAQIVMNYNLYRGGADKARELQAARGVNQALDLQEKVCRDVRQNVMIGYNDVKRLREQMVFRDQHRLSTEKAREAYRQQYDIGQRTLLDLLDTQNEFFEATRAYTNARYDLAIAESRTLNGMGGLMNALGVARTELPSPSEVGQKRERDYDGICSIIDDIEPAIDKDKLLADAPPLQRAAPIPIAKPAPAPEKITFSADAFFDYDKSVLKEEGINKLTDFAAKMKATGKDKEMIIAVGHTDGRGSVSYNMKLSLARANAVKTFLITKGLNPDLMKTEGKGKSEPIATNDTDEGRARNRRVEIIFSDRSTVAVAAKPASMGAVAATTATAAPQSGQDIEKSVMAWASAWASKDMQAYFGAYSSKFEPAKGLTRERWEAQRKQRIEPRQLIEVQLSDIQIESSGDVATVKFSQNYRSDNVKEISRKSLSMTREGGRWLIVKEVSE